MRLKWFEIDRNLVPIKAHYFFWQAGLSSVQPNLTSFARQLGFSSVVVGYLYTVMPIISILIRLLFGMVADKFRLKKEIFIGSELLVILSLQAVYHIPALARKYSVVDILCTTNQSSVFQITADNFLNNCSIVGYRNNPKFQNEKVTKITIESNITVSLLTEEIMIKNDKLIFPIKEIEKENRPFFLCNGTNETFNYKFPNTHNFDGLFPYPKISNEQLRSSYWCWLFFMAMLLYFVGSGIVNSLGDAICFELLGDNVSYYGRQRLFGALGWGIFSVISGFVTDIKTNGKPSTDYSFCFWSSLILMCLDIIVCIKINVKQTEVSKNLVHNVGLFFLNSRCNIFFIWCFIIGMCTGLIWQFLYWLIDDLLFKEDCVLQYYEKSLEGLIQFVETVLGEVPFFFISGWIMKKIGHYHVMSIVMLCLGVRLLLYSVVSNPWWFLPIELFNGIDFGLCFSCMASYASAIALPGTEATMQALVGALYEGIGSGTGSGISGVLYYDYGGVLTFRYFGYLAVTVAILHVIIGFILDHKTNIEK